jgi:hypothetical protein
MKKQLLIVCASLMLASCGVNSSLLLNHNQSVSQVQLASSNFKVTGRVSGKAEVRYICMIGGLRLRQLYNDAYSELIRNAGLVGGSKALINIVNEEHVGGVPPFYFKRTLTISANVIEFTK